MYVNETKRQKLYVITLTRSIGFVQRAEASAIQVQALNPRVLVKTEDEDIEKKTDDFFEQFDVVCVTNASKSTLVCTPILRHTVLRDCLTPPSSVIGSIGWDMSITKDAFLCCRYFWNVWVYLLRSP
jgi:hypothetical protein